MVHLIMAFIIMFGLYIAITTTPLDSNSDDEHPQTKLVGLSMTPIPEPTEQEKPAKPKLTGLQLKHMELQKEKESLKTKIIHLLNESDLLSSVNIGDRLDKEPCNVREILNEGDEFEFVYHSLDKKGWTLKYKAEDIKKDLLKTQIKDILKTIESPVNSNVLSEMIKVDSDTVRNILNNNEEFTYVFENLNKLGWTLKNR